MYIVCLSQLPISFNLTLLFPYYQLHITLFN